MRRPLTQEKSPSHKKKQKNAKSAQNQFHLPIFCSFLTIFFDHLPHLEFGTTLDIPGRQRRKKCFTLFYRRRRKIFQPFLPPGVKKKIGHRELRDFAFLHFWGGAGGASPPHGAVGRGAPRPLYRSLVRWPPAPAKKCDSGVGGMRVNV